MKIIITFLCLTASYFTAFADNGKSFGFIQNQGQIADRAGNLRPEVLFMYKSPNAKICFQKDRIIYYFEKVMKRRSSQTIPEIGKPSGTTIGETRIDFVMKGSNPNVEIVSSEKNIDFKINYFLAHCPNGVTPSSYKVITYKNIYPQIDIIFKETSTGLKYDIILHKGADIRNVKFIYEGAKKVSIQNNKLIVQTDLYSVEENIPLAFVNDDENQKTDVKFNLNSKHELSFDIDKTLNYEKLTIDPTITWLTLFEVGAGSYMDDFYTDLTTDANGNSYVVFGGTDANLPVLNPGGTTFYDPTINGSSDIYLAKFDSNRSFVWGTYYGGTDYDITTGATVLTTGNGALHLLASVESTNAPMPNAGGGAYYSTTGKVLYGNFNLATGNLYHATKVGGLSLLYSSIAINSVGDVAIAYPAYNFSNVPILNKGGAYNQATNGGFTDIFFMTLNSSLAQTWGTYLGGAGSCNGVNVTYDSNNNLFFVAEVGVANPASTEHLINPGGGVYFQNTGDGSYDLQIGKFNTASNLIWNTLYGGNGRDGLGASMGNNSRILCNSSNEIIVCGGTSSTNLPVLNPGGGAYYVGTPPVNISNGGSYPDYSSFLLKFTNTGVRQWATYWGDNNGGGDHLWSMAIDKCNNLFALGRSHGMVAINQPGFYNNSLPYVSNSSSMVSFMMKFNSSLQATWASYIGDTTSYKFMSYVPNTSRLLICGTVNEAFMSYTDPGGGAYFDNINNSDYKQSFSMLEFNTVPTPIISSGSFTVCSSATVALTATGGIGSTYDWYTASSGGTAIFTGSVYTTPAVTTNTTYYVTSSNGTCVSDRAPVTVSVTAGSSVPSSVSASAASICSGGSSLLTLNGGSLITGDTWRWYSGSCGGTLEGTGTTLNVSPLVTTTYYVRAEGSCGNTSCSSVNVTVNSISAAPTSVNTSTTTACAGSTTTLTVNGGSLGAGANWQWFTGSCNGTSVGSGNSITVSPAVATTYYVNAVGSCNTTACANVNINVNSNSTAASSINTTTTTLCSGGSATLTVNGGALGTAANWQWYSGSCGGTLLGSGTSLIVSPSSTTTYYLRAEGVCGNTSCVSTVITLNSVSSAPSSVSASSSSVCSGSSATLTVNGGSLGTGANWQWFSGSCNGTAVGSGSSVTVSPGSSTTYFVSAVGSCNSTACLSTLVNVNVPSIAPTSATASSAAICSGNSTTLTVNGGSLGNGGTWKWYVNGCGTTLVGTGTSITVSPAITTAYFVRAEDNCGNSLCTQLTVSVTATPSAAWTSPGTICAGTGILNLASLVTGNTGGTWLGTGIAGSSLDPSALGGQTVAVTYSVANGSCTAASNQNIIVANSVSAAWTSPGSVCASNGTVNLSTLVTGSTGGSWTGTGVTGTTFDPTTLSGNIAVTYSIGSGSCSDSKTYSINVTPLATANWVTPGTLCASNGTVNLNSYLSGTTGGTWTGTGITGNVFDPTSLAGQTVLIGYQVGTAPCTASQSHSIQVVNIANASFTVPLAICENAASLNLNNAVTGNAGGTFTGIGVTANTFNPTGLAGQSVVITYSVGTSPCSAFLTQTITVSASPVAPIASVSNATICSGQTTTVSANGSGSSAIYTVYSSPSAVGSLGSTPLVLSPVTTTTYYIQAVANGCSNLGGDVPFTINVNQTPLANAGIDQNICLGSQTTLIATGGGTYLWSTTATTNSIVVTPTVNTTYTVTVTAANLCSAQDVVTVTIATAASLQANNDNATLQTNQTVTTNVASNDTGDPNTVTVVAGPSHGSVTLGANGNITYTPSNGFSGTDTVYYSICDAGCSSICKNAKWILTVTKEILVIVPGGFSPNGDGHNDVFVIKGLEFYPDNELIIFNRWGDEIYKAAPYKNDWDGQAQGKGLTLYGTQLVEGTYFYIFTLDKDSKPMKGYVELKRK